MGRYPGFLSHGSMGFSGVMVPRSGLAIAGALSSPRSTLPVHGVDNIDKREPVEICVPGVNRPESMLTHKDGNACIEDQVAPDIGDLVEHLRRDRLMSLGWDQWSEAGGSECGLNKGPRIRQGERLTKHIGVG